LSFIGQSVVILVLHKEPVFMNKLTLEDLELNGKKVFLRVDFNVPLDENRQITDDNRIKAALPTIKYLLKNGARLILISHLGRPKGSASEEFSLRPVAERLEKILGQKIVFSPAVLGPVAETAIDCLEAGDCLLMENIRFFPEEEKNDSQFSKDLASLADIYINDAFGAVHRAHASTAGVARYFDQAACGYLIKKELEFLTTLSENPKKPFCAIIGGAKVKDKIQVISSLLEKADSLLIGGGMAYTFLKVKGYKIGNSILDEEHLGLAEEMLKKADELKKTLLLPVDHIVADSFDNAAPFRTVKGNLPDGVLGMDIGPETIDIYLRQIEKSGTVFWNGPMGVFEMSHFSKGTFEIARGMAANGGVTVVGGGDSVAAVNKANLAAKMSHISTGGGASLKYLEGKPLPGIEALTERK
jgi:3-phosphoglycerate kinase